MNCSEEKNSNRFRDQLLSTIKTANLEAPRFCWKGGAQFGIHDVVGQDRGDVLGIAGNAT